MRQIITSLRAGFNWLCVFIFSLFTIVVYFAVTYLLGWELLVRLLGNDTFVYLARLKFLSDYFPKYPFWTHLEGGGVSAIYGYPILTHTLLISVSKLTKLGLIETLKLAGFSSIPLFSFGIFTYARVKFRSLMVAFLAGLFYILSPIAWIWLTDWGFYAEAISSVIFPFIILFYDLFISRAIKGERTFRTRLFFVLTSFLMALSFLAHPTVFTASVSFISIYTILLSITVGKKRLKVLFAGFKYFMTVLTVSLLLISFWFVPFYQYKNYAAKTDVAGRARADEYYANDIELEEIFSFKIVTDRTDRAYTFRNLSFPMGISILYILGLITIVLSSFAEASGKLEGASPQQAFERKYPGSKFMEAALHKRKGLVLALSSLLMLFAAVSAPFIFLLAKLPFLSYFASWRSFIYGGRLFVPAIAAFSGYGLGRVLLFWLKTKRRSLLIAKNFFLFSFTLAFSVSVLWVYQNKPYFETFSLSYLSYGKESVEPSRATYLRDIFRKRTDNSCAPPSGQDITNPICQSKEIEKLFSPQKLITECRSLGFMDHGQPLIIPGVCEGDVSPGSIQNLLDYCALAEDEVLNLTVCEARSDLPTVFIEDLKGWRSRLGQFPQSDNFEWSGRKLLAKIPNDPFIRYDTSPTSSIYSQLGPYFKKTPILPVYISTSSLIHRMWGYQMSNFYVDDPIYQDPSALSQLAQWFGVSYLIKENTGENDKLFLAGFKKDREYPVFSFEKSEPIVSWSSKQRVLVVGQKDQHRIYDSVFKKAPFGLIDYDEAMIVEGVEEIGGYDLEELRQFDVVFMHGYRYNNRDKAWGLLEAYVREGGKLFIETGWEFTSADYNVGKTPAFFPITELKWTSFGKTNNYSLHEGTINTQGIDVLGFEPLVWDGLPWSVSSGDRLREWARPILTVGGHPLIAGGQHGKGRVVWSGMNLLSHIPVFDSTHPEMVLAGRLMDYLFEEGRIVNYQFGVDYTAQRSNPDRVEFVFNTPAENTSLYFKEAYYPYWKAKLIRAHEIVKLPIYTAGPGFMLVIPGQISRGDKIVFEIVSPWILYLSHFVSIVAVVGMIMFLVRPELFDWFRVGKFIKIERPFGKAMENDEEVNY